MVLACTPWVQAAPSPAASAEPAARQPKPVAELHKLPAYQSAKRAMAGGLPGIATDKTLEILATTRLTDDDARELKLMLVEAAVRGGRAADLPPIAATDLPDTVTARFWYGQLLALLGRLSDAEQLLGDVANDESSKLRDFASLARASLLVALREPDAALAALQPAADGKDQIMSYRARQRQAEILLLLNQPAAARTALATLPKAPGARDAATTQYLEARLAEASGEHATALATFEKVAANPRGLPVRMVHACLLGAARARNNLGQTDVATDALIAFVNAYPESTLLPAAFEAMATAGVFADSSRKADVETWEKSSDAPLAALALLHHARAIAPEQAEKMLPRFEAFLLTHKTTPQAVDIALRRVELLANLGKSEEARAALTALDKTPLTPDQESIKGFLGAKLTSDSGNHQAATAEFSATAARNAPEDAAAARYNAGLSALLADDSKGFEDALAGLIDSPGTTTGLGARLLLERGLYLSARDAGSARLMLWRYLQAAPNDPDRSRAYLVLAELALRESPADPGKATNQLEKIPADAPAYILERRDYLLVWTADIANDTKRAVEAANFYLSRWPDSTEADEIRFKIGAILAADGQHAAARAYFEILSDKITSPWREQALFQSGRSAALSLTESSLDDAAAIFQKVAEMKGPLAFQARQEQARLLFRLGKTDAAITLIKETLAAKPAPDEATRRSLMFQQAEILLERHGGDMSDSTEAGKIFDQLANDPAAPVSLRNRASWFLGRAAMAVGNTDGALRTWYDTVDASFPAGQAPLESEWAFRCGLSVIESLTQRQDWAAAAAMAARLGASGAPRADEAAALHERLRLEHFLWEQPEQPKPATPRAR